jgi:hypothetical protein
MTRSYHLQFIDNPKYYGTAAEVAAERLESLIVAKSHAFCDDAVDWDAIIQHAQANLAAALKTK